LRKTTRIACALVFACLAFVAFVAATRTSTAIDSPAHVKAQRGTSQVGALAPVDPQKWQDQQDMTWADYHPIPGVNWADSSQEPARKLRVALVAIDFPDQPFVITLPKQSDLFGNPQADPIKREDVPRFYADFFGKPGPLNHGHTINGFWMEQTRGKVGIPKIDAFGPYRMPKNLFEYGLNEYNQQGGCPTGFKCDGRMEPDADALWQKDAGADIKKNYDIILRIYAGYDETGVWQEFGEMKFQTKDDIPAEWGNPDTTKPRWVATRYVPWTSWKAGAQQWGLSSVRQGENSGTITHEIAHLTFRIGDNNNNPYIEPYRRVGSGPWDLMDRGSFNGPGGPHRRWVVPAAEGAFMPAGLMLRSRILLDFVRPENVLALNRNALARSGLVVATVVARAMDPGPTGLAGITVALDGEAPKDKTPPCDMNKDPLCAGDPVFDYYSLEVVQRIGYDSFTPDNGVLLAKNKIKPSQSCGYGCFTWVIDAHPENIRMPDFKRPDGTPVMRTVADYRQLNDALFHAGLDSGSQYEWEDAPNRLHFYVIDVRKDASAVLSYTVGVRSLDGHPGAGPQTRGVALAAPAGRTLPAATGFVNFTLKNTGTAAATDPSLHPRDATAYLNADVYRLSVSVDRPEWSAQLRNALAAVKFGESMSVPVYVTRAPRSAGSATVTLKASSESDPTKAATVKWVVSAADSKR
jgi:M6 family metalloprotease-like protein